MRLSKHLKRRMQDDPDVIRAMIQRQHPGADEAAIDHCLRRWLDERANEANRRPLFLHEIIDRWGDEDAVGRALLAGHLRPIDDERRLRFPWLQVLAIEPSYTIRTGQPHPNRARRARSAPEVFKDALKEHLSIEARKRRLAARENHEQVDIYYIEAVGSDTCKIGKTVNVESRFRSLRTLSAHPLRLVAVQQGTHALERDLHRQFASERTHGEWFHLSDALRAHIAEIKRANGLPDWALRLERSRRSREAAAKRKAQKAA